MQIIRLRAEDEQLLVAAATLVDAARLDAALG